MCGVTNMTSSFFTALRKVPVKSLPNHGMSPRSGTLRWLLAFSDWINPPRTMVVPSRTRLRVEPVGVQDRRIGRAAGAGLSLAQAIKLRRASGRNHGHVFIPLNNNLGRGICPGVRRALSFFQY